MKKVSTATGKTTKNFLDHKLTIGLDLGDRSSWYCVLDERGEVLLEQRLGTTPKAMKEVFGAMPTQPDRVGDRGGPLSSVVETVPGPNDELRYVTRRHYSSGRFFRQALFFDVIAENGDQRCSTSLLPQCGH
jgi:hypothetical protein